MLAVAGFNGDGRDDILAGSRDIRRADGQPEDRHDQTPIHVFLDRHDGRFRHAPRRFGCRINARDGRATVADFNEDGWPDIALFDVGTYVGERSLGFGNPPELYLRAASAITRASPLVYRNNGSGRFRAMTAAPFACSDRHFGFEAVPLEVNGDGAVDFIVPRRGNGPDGRYGTEDDYTTFVTLFNTTAPHGRSGAAGRCARTRYPETQSRGSRTSREVRPVAQERGLPEPEFKGVLHWRRFDSCGGVNSGGPGLRSPIEVREPKSAG